MTGKPVGAHRTLVALWAMAFVGCGDGVGDARDDGPADVWATDADVGKVNVPDTPYADQDVIDTGQAETVAETEDATDAVDALPVETTTTDALEDAAPEVSMDDAVDVTATDATGTDADDTSDVEDAAVDADEAAADTAADGLDPQCPYDPAKVCLRWGVCTGAKIKVSCEGGEPDCDYSAVANFEVIEKSCDGLDNDCNNLVDDSLKPPLASKQTGVCQGKMMTCAGAAGWADPDFELLAQYQEVESACDGLDNDCDGVTDAFLADKKLIGFTGICAEGSYICGGTAGWQLPDITALPFWEPVETMCDALDNDCDGLTDEDMDTPNFLGSGVKVNNQGVCNGAPIRCLQGVWSPPDYAKQPGYEAVEATCDGLDNDCNGLVDELAPTLASKQAGVCTGNKLVCMGVMGWQDPDWTLLPGYSNSAESQCDGVDNDCDGLTDEDAACPMWQVGGRGSGKIALSADGQQLAWTTMQGAQVLDWQTQTVTRDWFGHDHAVTAVAFSADGARVATTGQTDVLQVWPVAESVTPSDSSKTVLSVGGLSTSFAAVAFSPDGGQVAVGEVTGAVRIYALWSGQQIAALLGHKAPVAALAWLAGADGQNGPLLTGDEDGAVRRWQVATKTGQQIALMQGGVRSIAALPDSMQVLLVADDQAVVVDAGNGQPQAQLLGGAASWAGGALRPDVGGEALLVDSGGTVRRYSLPTPTGLLADVTPTQTVLPPPEVAGDTAASLVAAAGHVAVGFVAQGPWRLELAASAWSPARVRHIGAVRDAAVTGSLLVTGGDDTAIRLWRAMDGNPLTTLWGHQGAVLAVQPLTQLPNAPAGSDLSTLLGSGLGLASGSDDFTVRLWYLTPAPGGVGVLTPKIFGLGGPWPEDLALTADVQGIWAAGGPTLSKFSTEPAKAGQKLNAYPTKLGNVIERVVPSPDGQWLALGLSGDGPAFNVHYRIIHAKTFAVLHEWSGMPTLLHAVAWSADSTRVALAGTGGVIQIAEVQSGAVVDQLFGHLAAITSLAWSPSGRLLSTSEDGTARIWSAASGKPILQAAVFSRHCPVPCNATSGIKIAVLGGLWLDAKADGLITFASDGSLFGWKAPVSP